MGQSLPPSWLELTKMERSLAEISLIDYFIKEFSNTLTLKVVGYVIVY